MGWYTTRNGVDEFGLSTKININKYQPSDGQTIYARYKTLNGYVENPTSNITLYAPDSRDTDLICFLGTENGDPKMYINSGIEINVYKESELTVFDPAATPQPSTSNVAEQLTTNDGITRLVVKLDCDIVLEGKFQLNSAFYYNGQQFCTQIVDAFTALDLNGYTMTIRNGGQFNAFGIVYNSKDTGGIIVEDGEIYTCFSVIDHKGAGALCLLYTRSSTPFYVYCMPYLTCEIVFGRLGRLRAFTALTVQDSVCNTSFYIINAPSGSSSLITIERGYCIKRSTSYDDLLTANNITAATTAQYNLYDENFRETLIFTNEVKGHLEYLDISLPTYHACLMSFVPLTMTVVALGTSVNLSLKNVDFPIASFYDLEFYSVHMSVSSSLLIMPGASVYVDDASIINMTSTNGPTSGVATYKVFARITVIDEYPRLFRFTASGSTRNYSTALTNICDGLRNLGQPDVTMNGKFTFDSSNVDFTSSFGHFYSVGGHINCSKQAVESLKENAEYIELITRFYYPLYYYYSNTPYFSPYEYYTLPLISNDIAYFQPDGKGTTIVAASDYNDDDSVYEYGGSYYFYEYTLTTQQSRSNYYQRGITSVLTDLQSASSNGGPSGTYYIYKCEDLAGEFTAASSYSSLTSGSYSTSFIRYNNQYRVNVSGVWMAVTSVPGANSTSFSNLSLSSTNNKLKTSILTMGSTLTYNTTYKGWQTSVS